jgi:DNA-binding FrmR family transcriptional regulator
MMRVSDFMRGISGVQDTGRSGESHQPSVNEATIKQKVSATEAVVEIDGQEIKASFEKGVPMHSSVLVQIIGERDGVVQLRPVIPKQNEGEAFDGHSVESSNIVADKLLREVGFKSTPEMREAIRSILKNSKLPITKEMLQNVQQVMQKGEGTLQQKLETLEVMAKKNIDITPKSFEAVSRTLYGPTIDKLIETLGKEIPEWIPKSRVKVVNKVNNTAVREIGMSKTNKQESGKEISLSQVQRDLADLVFSIRSSGKVTRVQIDDLQKVIQRVLHEVGGSLALQKDIYNFINRLSKDLGMSISYEAVGRGAEGKAMVQRTMDQIVQLFKLPVSEVARVNASLLLQDENTGNQPQILETLAQTYDRLSGIVASARSEIQSTFTSMPTFEAFEARSPHRIVQDLSETLHTVVLSEGLPPEVVQKIKPLLQSIERAISQHTSGSNDRETGIPSLLQGTASLPEKSHIIDQMTQLQQLFETEGERLSAYANIQSADFERVSNYIPEHLHDVASEFKQMKNEVITNIDRMCQFLNGKVPHAASYVQRIIEPTIEMINRLVSKGEFALFSDMEFEHNVLKISGQLQSIKDMLENGKTEEAIHTFQSIRGDLEKLNWQPSYMKVERFFSKKVSEGAMQNPFERYGDAWKSNSLTGRGVQEWVRGMGMNYERDALEWLKQRSVVNPFSDLGPQLSSSLNRQPTNIKSMVMEQLNMGNLTPRAREVLEQTLSNLTGQQLLSKPQPDMPQQSMYIQLPLPWEQGMQSVQMHINARNNSGQMDWENCNLFFYLNTPKFGDMGIGVTVVNRDMSLRIMNDNTNVKDVLAPYIPSLEQQLQGLGYRVNGISFVPLSDKNHTLESNSIIPAIDVTTARIQVAKQMAREGVDFSV